MTNGSQQRGQHISNNKKKTISAPYPIFFEAIKTCSLPQNLQAHDGNGKTAGPIVTTLVYEQKLHRSWRLETRWL